MRKIKKIIKITEQKNIQSSDNFWMLKTPQERIEAAEIIREHYYIMRGYNETPRIKKTIKISSLRPH
ncbi:MAG: hypothetical protein A2W19_15395 [Spirochaetes bacterium RBG_16_49_21]|nr:MAG: hypothetical protein A2W19_15395 [Spirochaetes bacterium RBG_16_49_21]